MDSSLFDRFSRYVTCSSESGNEANLYTMLKSELEDLGLKVMPCASQNYCLPVPNLYARLEGQGEPILYVAHMDTVKQSRPIQPYISDGTIYSEGDCILGADDKSGIAAIMDAVSRIVKTGVAAAPVEILFTVSEETGLNGSLAATFSMIRSKRGYVFDSSAEFGSITMRSPYITKYRFDVRGKSAHAAIHPEQGIHALLAAAKTVCALDWGRVDSISVTNVGNFSASSATNVICEYASFEAEVRSFEQENAARLVEKMKAVASKVCGDFGAQVDISELSSTPGFSLSDDSPVLEPVTCAFLHHGISPMLTSSYGGSDANILNANGIAAVNISTGMKDPHSSNESIKVKDFERLTDVIFTLMGGDECLSGSN